ncbi:MAG: hypothetical protein WBW74_22730, partial [Xanthobacteraceae bacterium]
AGDPAAVTADTERKADGAAACTGSGRCQTGTAAGAQARATAAQGMAAGQEHGGGKRSPRLQVSFVANVR